MKKLLLILAGLASSTYAAPITITEMLANLNTTWSALFNLVETYSLVFAIFLTVVALHKGTLVAKEKAEAKTVIIYMFIAGILFALPTFLDVISSSFFYQNGGAMKDQNQLFLNSSMKDKLNSPIALDAAKSLINLLRVVGFIAIVRGLAIIKSLGDPKAQGASFWKAVLFIVPGGALMNIVQVSMIFGSTVGISF